MTSLEDYLDEYLRSELASRLLPRYMQQFRFAFRPSLIWVVITWVYALAAAAQSKGLSGAFYVLCCPVGIMAVLGVAWQGYLQTPIGRALGPNAKPAQSRLFRRIVILLLVVPTLYGYMMGSFAQALTLLAVLTGAIIASAVAFWIHRRGYVGIEYLRAVAIVFITSSRRFASELAVFVALFLLAIFTPGMWRAVGNDPPLALGGAALLLGLPPLILLLANYRRIASQLINGLPTPEEAVATVSSLPVIASGVEEGYISREELEEARTQLAWRHQDRFVAQILPGLLDTVGDRLTVTILIAALVLGIGSFGYFVAMISLLVPLSSMADWVGWRPIEEVSIRLPVFGIALGFAKPYYAAARVSLMLSLLISGRFVVAAITDQGTRERITGILARKARGWLAAGLLHRSLHERNFMYWQILSGAKHKVMTRISIIVRSGLTDADVRIACGLASIQFWGYRKAIVVTAFERHADPGRYRLGVPGRRWRLTLLAGRGEKFEPMHLELERDNYRDNHRLGKEKVASGDLIPDEWFGNSTDGQRVAKLLWTSGQWKELVLHPHVFVTEDLASIEIHLTKRLRSTTEYAKVVKEIFRTGVGLAENRRNLIVTLEAQETPDILAEANWLPGSQLVIYRDECLGRSRAEALQEWLRRG